MLYWSDYGYILAETRQPFIRYTSLSTAFVCVPLLFANIRDELPKDFTIHLKFDYPEHGGSTFLRTVGANAPARWEVCGPG